VLCPAVWEVFCGKQAWHGLHYGVVVERVVIQGERPVVPEDMPEELVLLMRRCWDADPTKRPSFEQVGRVYVWGKSLLGVPGSWLRRLKASLNRWWVGGWAGGWVGGCAYSLLLAGWKYPAVGKLCLCVIRLILSLAHVGARIAVPAGVHCSVMAGNNAANQQPFTPENQRLYALCNHNRGDVHTSYSHVLGH
jgi:hypothetical protein